MVAQIEPCSAVHELRSESAPAGAIPATPSGGKVQRGRLYGSVINVCTLATMMMLVIVTVTTVIPAP